MKKGTKRPPNGSQGCGTDAGYQRHVAATEDPCEACRDAHRELQRQPEVVQARRDYDKARVHTNTRMRELHSEEWQEIFDAERSKIVFDREWEAALGLYTEWVETNEAVAEYFDTEET